MRKKYLAQIMICHSVICLILLFQYAGVAQAEEHQVSDHLALNTFTVNPLSNDTQTGMVDLLLKEAFSRLNIEIGIINLPAERALINANNGVDDGDFVRIDGLSSMYPNLIKVPEKILDFEFVAFSKSSKLENISWENIKSYSVGIIRGWKILEEKVINSQNVTMVRNPYQLFRLLENDRVDIIIYDRLEGYGVIKELNLNEVKVMEPPLIVRPMYLYLNKKHADLVNKVSDSLTSIKADGTYDKIVNDTLIPFIPQR